MSKNINIAAHVKRYEQTELSDIVKLIKGLTELVESRKADTITQMEEQLALLKKGEIPVQPVAPERVKTTRGSKKVKSEQEVAEG
jgi:hypothetical protein